MITAVNFQFKQLERRSLEKSGLQQDSNPWPSRYRCDALPTDLWSHTLERASSPLENTVRTLAPYKLDTIQSRMRYSIWMATKSSRKWKGLFFLFFCAESQAELSRSQDLIICIQLTSFTWMTWFIDRNLKSSSYSHTEFWAWSASEDCRVIFSIQEKIQCW